MRQSELALFAQEFQRALEPLGAALRHGCLRSSGEHAAALGALADELEALSARVARERAAVYVFGPAKAGKSTLLEALAASPLGAATRAPTYPCLRRLRHGERPAGAARAFDGTSTILADPAALGEADARAHRELAAQVRAARAAGEAFDPARHFPVARRAIERELPCAALQRGALELVECPPIHAPLFSSYAEMWIGEPDQARAGVFVVRPEQLADDGSFDGIEELLERFERLILVLNLEHLERSGETDLAPAELLGAWLELTTCEPLAAALRAGRVPVLALDLRAAARARALGHEEEPGAPEGARFADLEGELAAALDRHEALRALGHSAARRARELVDDARALAESSGLEDLARQLRTSEHEHATLAAAQTALNELAERPRARWETPFDALHARLAERAGRRAAELVAELAAPLARALEDWFASGASLTELLGAQLEPRLVAARAELGRWATRTLREELAAATDSLLSPAAAEEFRAARLPCAGVLAACAEQLRIELEPVPGRAGDLRALDVEAIPVRVTLGERLLWRSIPAVRRALFGPPEAPAKPVTSRQKEVRLGGEARERMLRSILERATVILGEEARRMTRSLEEAFLSVFVAELQRHVERERRALRTPLAELERRAAELGTLAAALGALAPACAHAERTLAELAERFRLADTLVPAARRALPLRAGAPAPEPAFE